MAFLFQFGTGPIRGFAVTLSFGLASNLFTSIFVSKTLFDLALASGSRSPRFPFKPMHIFKDTHFDFLRWRWHAIALSWIVIIAGAVVFMTKGIPLGIEFAGGTAVIQVRSAGHRAAGARRRRQDVPGGGENVWSRLGDPSLNQIMVRVPHVGAEPGHRAQPAQAAGGSTPRPRATSARSTSADPDRLAGGRRRNWRSKALLRHGVLALGISGIFAFRFQFSFGVGAVVATIHDLLITMAFLAFFRYDMSLDVIAAILTMTGFSTNDTIVIFDRIRENLRGLRRDTLPHVINVSLPRRWAGR